MKNTIKLLLVSAAVLGLVGCAGQVKSNKAMKPAAVQQSRTTSTISLKTQGNLLVANVTTNWDPKANDSLVIAWNAPANSFCQNSQFSIIKAHQTNDQSWAYRTVVQTAANGSTQLCNGVWTAKVVNAKTGKVLASTSMNVNVQAPAAAPAPATTTAPAPAAPAA
jgi:outer membrane lipopolysaccharide assembly protein LptE/RlpB